MSLFSRTTDSIRRLSAADITRKIIYVLLTPWRVSVHFSRRLRFFYFTKCWVHYILGKVHINSLSHFTTIGKNATFYHNVVIEINEHSRLQIGKSFTLSYGAVISCQHSIRIGDYVMIGEYSSLRDSTHVYNTPGLPYSQQNDQAVEISIGNNVWIGRGCLVLPGTIIEDGVIVAAHSVVKGRLEAYSMYGGAPAKFIKRIVTG
jgi:acetyltransferase-like isoleucine patch superfamily enzyme